MEPTYIPTELTTVASEQLEEDIKKDLEEEDKSIAKLIEDTKS